MRQQIAYIGNCSDNGIYSYKFKKGRFIKIGDTHDFERCTYLTNSKLYLYSVIEVQDKENKNNGYVIAYRKNKNKLINIDKKTSYGQNPCHIEISKNKKLIFISNYTKGSFVVFKINKNGTIGDRIYFNTENSKTSHMHCAKTSNDGKYLFVSDLGEDSIIAYKIKADEVKEVSRIQFDQNTQPRHITIKGNKLYVITEATCKLYTLKFKNGKLSIIDVISILPKDKILKKEVTGCAIKISKDFRYIYVTIRGDNSISVYKIEKEKLKFIQNISCEGILPRDLEIDKSGKYVLVANQESNEISIFKRSIVTGKLFYENKEEVESPTCIILE